MAVRVGTRAHPLSGSGRRGFHRIVPAIVLVLLALLGATWLWQRAARPATRYSTVAASRGPVVEAVLASGTVNPVTTIQVGTYVSGVIQRILCDFNTRVVAGQLCAKIDPRPYQTGVEQAAAALATARSQLAKDRANLGYARLVDERNRHLLVRGFVSREAADAARNAYEQALAQVALDGADIAQREAQWRAARINLGYTDIVSPVDGTVVSRNVTQGQTVAASFQTPTLFLIATDLTRMQVDTNVSESDIGRVAVGDAAVFTVSSYPEREFAGRVEQVRQAPQTIQNVVTYDVVVGVANPDQALKPGMTASMRIVTRRAADVLRVPAQALRYRPAGAGAHDEPQAGRGARVWVLADGKPRRVPVGVGLDDGTYVEVTGGALRAGEPVIVTEQGADTGRRPAAAPGTMVPLRR
jgi:HlyD family secretion protein